MTENLQIRDVPLLPHYITVAQAARLLNMTKTSVFYNIKITRRLREVFRIGDEDEGDRPVVLILRQEVENLAAELAQEPGKAYDQLLNDWNRRVKQWGFDTGWDKFRISEKGIPRKELSDDYLAVHPDDTRPAKR